MFPVIAIIIASVIIIILFMTSRKPIMKTRTYVLSCKPEIINMLEESGFYGCSELNMIIAYLTRNRREKSVLIGIVPEIEANSMSNFGATLYSGCDDCETKGISFYENYSSPTVESFYDDLTNNQQIRDFIKSL